MAAQVATVARLMRESHDSFVAVLAERTRREIAPLDHDERLQGLLEASITENVVTALNYLERGGDAADLEAPSAAMTYARTLAQREVPLSALIRAYRLGQTLFLDAALALVDQVEPDRPMTVVPTLVRQSTTYLDLVIDRVGTAYEAERDRWFGGGAAVRRQWVADLVAGRPVDSDRAAEALGYRLGGYHLAAEIWAADEVTDAAVAAALEAAVAAVGRHLGVGEPLVVPTDDRQVVAWWAVAEDTTLEASAVAEALGPGAGVLVAAGRAEPGVEGFRRTRRQAERVRRVRLASGRPEPVVTTLEDVALVALLSHDVDGLRRFVRRILGDLAVDDERAAMLRETLRVFLTHRGSFAATATALTLHRNSVQYRVEQARLLCAVDPVDPVTLPDLLAALDAAHWLGRAVLSN